MSAASAKTSLNPSIDAIRATGAPAALLFIHGFSGNLGLTWRHLADLVSADPALMEYDIFSIGYPTSLMPNVPGLWSAEPSLATLADYLRTTAAYSALGNARCLAIAAHSMGGLIVQRACLDDAEFSRRISHIILFGTPSNGLKKARFLFFKRQTKDMAKDSPFIADLRTRWDATYGRQAPFKFLAVAGDMDEFVPRASSIDVFPQEQRAVIPGNHLEMIRPNSREDLSYMVFQRFLTGAAAPAGPLGAARLAVESREFHRAVALFRAHGDALDEGALVQYALALEGLGQAEEAVAALERFGRKGTDALGTLAGRIKRRWLAERCEPDGRRALDLYGAGLTQALAAGDWPQCHYHAINAAFLSWAFAGNPAKAREYAAQALEYCAKSPEGKWRSATEAEASILLGRGGDAPALYAAAIGERSGVKPHEAYAMYAQALECAALAGDEALAEQLRRTFGF
ncbi:alpha/beta fold hydrolase [Solidesulfovibrio alcoholivorans]|uniref:alpha/beta fold hydrolase n=1 Tax=Solidesulfovibrio alcoholivorans TaxID=81406 RepID=UPI000B10EE30|nr:tetratricopeptide repeat-containing protein [Solidesulfovibrio alcoholivorans]